MYNHRHIGRTDSYNCSTYYLTMRKTNRKCCSHYIATKALRTLVLETIRAVSTYAIANEEVFVQRARSASEVRHKEAAKELQRKMARDKRRCAELDTLIQKLYESYAKGDLTEKRFKLLSGSYEQEQEELESVIVQEERQLETYEADGTKVEHFLELARKYTSFEELTTPMLNEFVEKIVVHAPDKSTGERIQEVEIHLKFIGHFDPPMPELTAEEIAETERLRKKREANRKSSKKYAEKKRQKKLAEKAKEQKETA